MLSVKTRQKYLKNLGFYKGKIDGIEGSITKKAYRNIQKKYFSEIEQDGIYGKKTELLLRNAERVRIYCKHFVLEEFKCECNGKYCTGYPKLLSINLLEYLEKIRIKHKKPIYVTSGLRCEIYNNILEGSIKNSKHTKGKAIDFYSSSTNNLYNRIKIMNYFIKLPYASYSYCDGYMRTKLKKRNISATYMGSSIHIDVL